MPEPLSCLPLSNADLHSLNQVLIMGGAGQLYAALEARGYGYADWASGVAASMDKTSDRGVGDYLRGTALMGIGSPICQVLTPTQARKLRFDLAKSYLRQLGRLARAHPEGWIERDLDADEADRVHAEGLQRNGLSVENWNLHFPLQVLRRLGGEAAMTIYWHYLRDVQRMPPQIGVLAKLATISFMYRQTMSDDLRCRQMSTAWLARNPSLLPYSKVEQQLELALDAVRNSGDSVLSAYLEVLDIEQHGVGGTGLRPLPKRAREADVCPLIHPVPDGQPGDLVADEASMAVYRELLSRLLAP